MGLRALDQAGRVVPGLAFGARDPVELVVVVVERSAVADGLVPSRWTAGGAYWAALCVCLCLGHDGVIVGCAGWIEGPMLLWISGLSASAKIMVPHTGPW